MSVKTYGYIKKINNNLLDLLELDLVILKDEFIVLGDEKIS